jgi:hypothetical protein
MSRELQDRRFDQSAYERPSLDWECGWASEGRPCPLGPDQVGQCVVTHQCTPSLRGDRWICARPPGFGGTCEEGPSPDGTCCNAIPPCQPKPSLRKRRGRVSRWAAVVTLSLCALAISGDSARDFISPGDVSLSHGAVGDCTDCHASGVGGAADWFTAAFHGGSEVGDSDRCLACHETNLGEFSRLPHSVPEESLLAVRERVVSQPSSGSQSIALAAARAVDVSLSHDGMLACASCHKEHRGREHDIRALSNDQCQVCHVKPFASLANGHPDFTNFPYERRTRIQFNHVAHKQDAFPAKRSFRCEDCHQIDVDGQVMLVVGYEKACGGCHAPQVDSSSGMFKRSGLYPGNSSDGVPFLALPGFDAEALEDAGIAVGQWPDGMLDQEDPLNPFMRLLLSTDEATAEALATLPDDEAFVDADDLEAVGSVLWGVKGLFYDIVSGGQAALVERLEGGLGRTLSSTELSLLTANLDVEAVAAAQRDWFPKLMTEVPAHRSGRSSATEVIVTETPEVENSVGWYRASTFDLRYRPSGHQDAFLRNWLEVATERNEDAPEGVLEALFANVAEASAEGGCVKCHSVDAVDGQFSVNWRQKRRDLDSRGSNRFLHSPHMTALSGAGSVVAAAPPAAEEVPAEAQVDAEADAGEAADVEAHPVVEPEMGMQNSCEQCHVLVADGSSATDESFEGHDPHSFASSFEPIEKSTCAGCHTSGEASDSCLNCHNYHIGERIPTTRPEREASASSADPSHAAREALFPHPAG